PAGVRRAHGRAAGWADPPHRRAERDRRLRSVGHGRVPVVRLQGAVPAVAGRPGADPAHGGGPVTGGPYPEEVRQVMGGADPTAEQWRAISMPLEPYVVVAGAGSGKTSVIAARVVYLALVALGRIPEAGHEGVWPGNVLCLTFTNKATEHL